MNLDDQTIWALFGGFWLLLGVVKGILAYSFSRRAIRTEGIVRDVVKVSGRRGKKHYYAEIEVAPPPGVAIQGPITILTDHRGQPLYAKDERVEVLVDPKSGQGVEANSLFFWLTPLTLTALGLLFLVVMVF